MAEPIVTPHYKGIPFISTELFHTCEICLQESRFFQVPDEDARVVCLLCATRNQPKTDWQALAEEIQEPVVYDCDSPALAELRRVVALEGAVPGHSEWSQQAAADLLASAPDSLLTDDTRDFLNSEVSATLEEVKAEILANPFPGAEEFVARLEAREREDRRAQ